MAEQQEVEAKPEDQPETPERKQLREAIIGFGVGWDAALRYAQFILDMKHGEAKIQLREEMRSWANCAI